MTGIARIVLGTEVERTRSLKHSPPGTEKRGKLRCVVIKWRRLADILSMSSIMTAESENVDSCSGGSGTETPRLSLRSSRRIATG
jgi:hypothetical protein